MSSLHTKTMILIAVILMDLAVGMEFDLFVPSFPELQLQFHLSPFLVEALLSRNFIGFCLSLFVVGSLADRFGRKPIILAGLIVFILGSIMCISGKSYLFLLLGRLLQGVGIASPAILSFLIIADIYSLKKQQYFMGILNGAMNTAVAISPVIGSYIAHAFHWQGNFTALLALGLLTLFISIMFLPKTEKHKRCKDPISCRGYLPLLKHKPLLLLMAAMIVNNVPYWIFVGMSPLLYINALHVPLKYFGYYQGVLALVFALGSLGSSAIIHRFDHKRLLYISAVIFVPSLFSIAGIIVTNSKSPLLMTMAFLPFIIGQIIPTTMLYPLCLNLMPQSKAKVSAILQGTRLILCAISLQVAGFYYTGSFKSIGIVIAVFIFIVIITLLLVVKNNVLMQKLYEH
jgi:MFS transporter, DHA1 family, multidrug resistance protein